MFSSLRTWLTRQPSVFTAGEFSSLLKVPLHFINEENSPAVKTEGCLVNHVITELQIQCLAAQLPEYITVDLGELTKGQTLTVKDLKLGKDIKVVTHGKPNPVVASTSVQAAEEEVAAPTVVTPAAAPVKAKKNEKQNKK